VIVDTSSIMAILFDEPDWMVYERAIRYPQGIGDSLKARSCRPSPLERKTCAKSEQ